MYELQTLFCRPLHFATILVSLFRGVMVYLNIQKLQCLHSEVSLLKFKLYASCAAYKPN